MRARFRLFWLRFESAKFSESERADWLSTCICLRSVCWFSFCCELWLSGELNLLEAARTSRCSLSGVLFEHTMNLRTNARKLDSRSLRARLRNTCTVLVSTLWKYLIRWLKTSVSTRTRICRERARK